MTLNDLKELKLELDELVQLRENLASTQERCSALLIENRRLTKRIAALEAKLGIETPSGSA